MEFISFGSIESLHNKVKLANKRYHSEQEFSVKPKLHGTNASIVVSNEQVYAQSRKNVITPEKDNAGFATFVKTLPITPNLADGFTWVIYGEWAGQGIQKNDAITQIGKKAFFVVCVRSISPDGKDLVTSDPSEIGMMLEILGIDEHQDVYIIPEIGRMFISFSGSVEHLQGVEMGVNELVDRFETVDPYVKETFGIEAPGEGVVITPVTYDWEEYKEFAFKAKTKSHSVNKSKKAASAKVEISPDVQDFADRFATVPRFEQALTELAIDTDMKSMGKFLKWVNEDVIKESKDELEESELEWHSCARQITNKAKEWFMKQAKRVV